MPLIWIDDGKRRFIPDEKSMFKAPKVSGIENEKIKGTGQSGHQSFAARLAQRTYERKQSPAAERHKILYAHEIMSSPVVTLPPSTTLAQAWLLIQDHRFRYIPIVNSAGAPLGIVSDRNLLKSAVTLGWNIFKSDENDTTGQTIGMQFLSPVLTSQPNAEIHSIAKAMFENHIGAMPIINDQNAVIGIITRSDILRALVHLGPLEIWG